MSEEKWAELNESYVISTHGRIFSLKRFKFLTGSSREGATPVVKIDGKLQCIATLVLKTFGGLNPKNRRMVVVNHIDYNKENNRLDNLRWILKTRHDVIISQPKMQYVQEGIWWSPLYGAYFAEKYDGRFSASVGVYNSIKSCLSAIERFDMERFYRDTEYMLKEKVDSLAE